MKPIGYYVSVPEEHEDYQGLKTLEESYGSYLERLCLDSLWVWLSLITRYTQTEQTIVVSSVPLTSQSCFDLIPFLHQVIKERLVKDVTN